MNSIDQIAEKLKDNPDVEVSKTGGDLIVRSVDEDAIEVAFRQADGKFSVHFEGRKDEFSDQDQALKSFISTLELFGLWPMF